MKHKNPKKINTTPQSKTKKIGAKISPKRKASSIPPLLKKQSVQKHNSDENLKSEVFTPPPADVNEAKKQVLTKAISRMSTQLNLSRSELSLIVGLSESTLSRTFKESSLYLLDPLSKEGQLAILLLRLYQNLGSFFGGNESQCEIWLRSENEHLGKMPIELIKSVEGLVLAVQYLDAMRGKI